MQMATSRHGSSRHPPPAPKQAHVHLSLKFIVDLRTTQAHDHSSLAVLPAASSTVHFISHRAGNTRPSHVYCHAGNAQKIQELRGLVASLEAAVEYTKAVAGAMPTLTQLLASSSVADVQVGFEVQGFPGYCSVDYRSRRHHDAHAAAGQLQHRRCAGAPLTLRFKLRPDEDLLSSFAIQLRISGNQEVSCLAYGGTTNIGRACILTAGGNWAAGHLPQI